MTYQSTNNVWDETCRSIKKCILSDLYLKNQSEPYVSDCRRTTQQGALKVNTEYSRNLSGNSDFIPVYKPPGRCIYLHQPIPQTTNQKIIIETCLLPFVWLQLHFVTRGEMQFVHLSHILSFIPEWYMWNSQVLSEAPSNTH